MKLQLDLTIAQNLDASLMEREVLRAILLEMIYRKESDIPPGVAFVNHRTGCLMVCLRLPPDATARHLWKRFPCRKRKCRWKNSFDNVPSFSIRPVACSIAPVPFALVQLLVDGSEGRTRLARYIDSLPDASNDPVSDLKSRFPLLARDAEKIWQSALTQTSSAQNYQLLTFIESERRLDELLRVKIPNSEKSLDLGGLARQKASAPEKEALTQLGRSLLLFVSQANPVLRPVAREYQQIAALLARGKRRGIAKRLTRLQNTREQLTARMSDVDDYMNWFEATQLPARSGVFLRLSQSGKPAPGDWATSTGSNLRLSGYSGRSIRGVGPIHITLTYEPWPRIAVVFLLK